MAKITLNPLAVIDASVATAINNNNTAITTAIENTLSRDGTTPNSMNADFDMNSHTILNLPTPVNPTDVIRKEDLESYLVNGTLDATNTAHPQNTVLASPSNATGTPSFRTLVGSDLPDPSATTKGGVNSKSAVTHQFINSIGTDGSVTSTQPSASDISGLGTAATLNVGTAANNIVQLSATGKLPAVDGSQLTNLPSSSGGGSITYNTLTDAIAASIDPSISNVFVSGFTAAGDGGAAWWRRVASQPTHLCRFQDALGAWWSLNEHMVYPEMIGTVNSSTDSAVLIERVFAFTNTCYLRPGATYWFTSTCDIPINCTLIGCGLSATCQKNANIDMYTMAGNSTMRDVANYGNGATRTGRGVNITTGNDQMLFDCYFFGFSSYCVQYAPDTGVRSVIRGGEYNCQNAAAPAISWPTDVTTGDRMVDGVSCGGCALLVTNGAQNGTIVNNDTTLISISSGSHKMKCSNNRIANAAIPAVVPISGTQHTIIGNILSGDVTLFNDLVNSVFSYNVVAGTITDGSDASNAKVNNIA